MSHSSYSHCRRILAELCSFTLFAAAGSGWCAERQTSPIKVTTTPATGSRGPVVKVETTGPVSNRYQAFDMADGTLLDLTGAHFASGAEHPMRSPIIAGEQERPPNSIHIMDGVVNGGIPREWNWFLTHAFSGAGFYTVSTGLQVIEELGDRAGTIARLLPPDF